MTPKINQYTSYPSSRYVMGIEGVAPSMQNEICPVVNTVTPRPYYWAFFVWCYYDFYNHEQHLKPVFKDVDTYIRRNNYFIALGGLLAGKRMVNNYIGADTIVRNVVLEDNEFIFESDYLQGLSTMGNYRAGIFDGDTSMNLVLFQNIDTKERYDKPKITPSGIKLAEAFDKVLSTTEYYQKYRLNNIPVPRNVLLDLGNTVSIDLSTFPECKKLLKEYLFERERRKKLRETKDFLQFIYEDLGLKLYSTRNCRRVLFDQYSPMSLAFEVPDELKKISSEWEVVIGRHYFVVGLQIIWKYMTEILVEPSTLDVWIDQCMATQSFSFDISKSVSEILDQQIFSFEEREEMISKERRKCDEWAVDHGIRIILSIYNRFYNRNDLSDKAKSLFDFGANDSSISMNDFFNKVDEYKGKTVKEFILYIIRNYVIRQHLNTAFLKMIRNVDGFYIEKIDKMYRRKQVFSFAFQGLRIEQLTSVMDDLECF